MGPGETVFIALIVIGLPVVALLLVLNRWFRFKEKRLELEAGLAIEKAAQYAASNAELEARVRVLEKIVTDGGIETAAQIEALRTPRLSRGDKVQ
jgi:ABC-type phosphate transport system auxiliary subunit